MKLFTKKPEHSVVLLDNMDPEVKVPEVSETSEINSKYMYSVGYWDEVPASVDQFPYFEFASVKRKLFTSYDAATSYCEEQSKNHLGVVVEVYEFSNGSWEKIYGDA